MRHLSFDPAEQVGGSGGDGAPRAAPDLEGVFVFPSWRYLFKASQGLGGGN